MRRSARSCVWQSRDWEDGSTYVALFNLRDTPGEVTVYFHELELLGNYAVRDLWAHKDLGEEAEGLTATLPAHGAAVYRLKWLGFEE